MNARGIFPLLFLLAIVVLPSYGQKGNSGRPTENQKLRSAELLADKFVRRFLETLDFSVPYNEFFTQDRNLRSKNARVLRGGLRMKVETVPDQSLDRFYTEFMNYYFLSNIWDLTKKQSKGRRQDSMPSEIATAIKGSNYFRMTMSDGASCCDNGEDELRTRAEVFQFTKDATRINALFRKYMPPNSTSSQIYKQNIKKLTVNLEKSSVTMGHPSMGVSDDRPVYRVERGLFFFYIFEESGGFKVFGLGIGN